MTHLRIADILVLIAYLALSVGVGCWFALRNRNTSEFTSAGGKLPGWLVGLSVFGAFVSSITFLALPATALKGNWNRFVFSLSLPIAAWISVKFFVPFYRRQHEVSAYSHLEKRFGVWARVYADVCYLLMHLARMGTVMYLLALPLHQLLDWDVRRIILLTGALTTIYTCLGGIEGVIWTDAMQSIILIGGAITCAVMLPFKMAAGPSEMFHMAVASHKFSLGSMGASVSEPTFWVVMFYGIFTNLQNFGVDQTFVQRYHTASSDREAKKSVWLGALVYVPISAMFLFIGTGLWAYYSNHPQLLPEALREQWAQGKCDNIFPYFIVEGLPAGVTGLLIAAVFAGAMATLSSNLNSAATITFSDLYKRFIRQDATERESMAVLYGSTLGWGALSTLIAMAMINVQSVLDAWWKMAGIFSGGMLGLFLLGLISRRANNLAAIVGVIAGILVTVWISLSAYWPASLAAIRSPFHEFLVIVLGTVSILAAGLLVSCIAPSDEISECAAETAASCFSQAESSD